MQLTSQIMKFYTLIVSTLVFFKSENTIILPGHTSEFRRQYGGSTAAVRRQSRGSTAAIPRQYGGSTAAV